MLVNKAWYAIQLLCLVHECTIAFGTSLLFHGFARWGFSNKVTFAFHEEIRSAVRKENIIILDNGDIFHFNSLTQGAVFCWRHYTVGRINCWRLTNCNLRDLSNLLEIPKWNSGVQSRIYFHIKRKIIAIIFPMYFYNFIVWYCVTLYFDILRYYFIFIWTEGVTLF